MRKFARELGVDLHAGQGHRAATGASSEATCRAFVKARSRHVRPAGAGAGLDLLAMAEGGLRANSARSRREPLSRIRRISKANLARNWVMIPHVTQFDEADVTDLEALRHEINEAQPRTACAVTMLAFVLKALVARAD